MRTGHSRKGLVAAELIVGFGRAHGSISAGTCPSPPLQRGWFADRALCTHDPFVCTHQCYVTWCTRAGSVMWACCPCNGCARGWLRKWILWFEHTEWNHYLGHVPMIDLHHDHVTRPSACLIAGPGHADATECAVNIRFETESMICAFWGAGSVMMLGGSWFESIMMLNVIPPMKKTRGSTATQGRRWVRLGKGTNERALPQRLARNIGISELYGSDNEYRIWLAPVRPSVGARVQLHKHS